LSVFAARLKTLLKKAWFQAKFPQSIPQGLKQAAEKRLFGLALFRSVWLFSELGLFGC
jgi:predicted component of type VI protein secretion system